MRAAFVVVVVALAACSSADEGAVKPFSTKGTSSSSSSSSGGDDDDDTVVLPPETDAGTTPPSNDVASPFHGTLSETPATTFGGKANHCTYKVALKNVVVDLTITTSGSVIGGTAKNDMTESIVGTCTFAPIGTVAQTFDLAQVSGTELTFTGTGGPKTKLTMKLTKVGASWEGASTWERTDQTDDLKWIVTSKLTLGPK